MTSPGELPSANSLVMLGVSWDTMSGRDAEPGGGTAERAECSVRVRVPGGPSELVPAIGLELNYRVPLNPTRHCIGHVSPRKNKGAYADCFNSPQPTEKTCVSCAVADAEFASNLHHAHTRDRQALDRAVVDHLEQTNVLYLAAFRDGSVKVGTSTEHRKTRRWIEQGAWQAVEVATVSDGFTVRKLEDLVTEKLGLTQSVAVKRKLQGMASPLSEALLSQRLDPLVEQVHEVIANADRLPGADDAQPESEVEVELSDHRWMFPTADAPVWHKLHRYPARLEAGSHHIEVLEMCGRMAVLSRPGSEDRFVADLAPLFGIELDIGHYEPDQLAVQDSLF